MVSDWVRPRFDQPAKSTRVSFPGLPWVVRHGIKVHKCLIRKNKENLPVIVVDEASLTQKHFPEAGVS